MTPLTQQLYAFGNDRSESPRRSAYQSLNSRLSVSKKQKLSFDLDGDGESSGRSGRGEKRTRDSLSRKFNRLPKFGGPSIVVTEDGDDEDEEDEEELGVAVPEKKRAKK
eukprot:TRINITY_DN1328_c0_g3_i1.p2 TRINITY_DN1328_c0_g3~~TRINITY_DN1328_c0_g3_i1.p2  ORF type:complete len:109 (+),score=34.67 TRINITY_DN1328_c0_g3_i1:355-681(+)